MDIRTSFCPKYLFQRLGRCGFLTATMLLFLIVACNSKKEQETDVNIVDKPFHDEATRYVFEYHRIWWDGYMDMTTDEFLSVVNKGFAGDNGTIDNAAEIIMLWAAHYRYSRMMQEFPDVKLLQDTVVFLDNKRAWLFENGRTFNRKD